MASFYNLPPPWHPGYADPTTVDAEGLVRGTFTTVQMPRGTYDDPTVGTAGYSVPRYVMDEGYGQGAFVTRPMPRGETVVPDPRYLESPQNIMKGARPYPDGGVEYRMSVMAGLGSIPVPITGLTPLPRPGGAGDPIREYGVRSARAITRRLMKAPAGERVTALRAVLNAVDPTLWDRVAQRSEKYIAAGQSSQAALEQALASSFSDGMMSEVVELGRTRMAPKRASLMGLGCYGCGSALGGVMDEFTKELERKVEENVATAFANTEPGYIEVGPFTFSNGPGDQRMTFHTNSIPPEWKKWFAVEGKKATRQVWAQTIQDLGGANSVRVRDGVMITGNKQGTTGAKPVSKEIPMKGAKLPRSWGMMEVVDASTMGLDKWFGMAKADAVLKAYYDGTLPIVRTVHPVSQYNYGIFFVTSPTGFSVHFKKIPPEKRSLMESIWDGITSIPAHFKKFVVGAFNAAKDLLEELGDLACKALNTEGAGMVAGAGAMAMGAPPQVGTTGADIGKGLCNGPPPPPPPPPSGIGLGWIAAGIAVAAGGVWYFNR